MSALRRRVVMSNEDGVAVVRADERSLEHDALEASRRQIQLLHVDYGCTRDHQPSYRLRTFNFEDAPKYRALSSAWGDPTPLHNFHIGDASPFIRQNLYSFLNTYDSPGCIWIDQVCIDKEEEVERNHQVGMMAGIYSNCKQVIIWLDSYTPEVKKSLDMCSRYQAH